jgi:hypothetical protein
MSGERWLGKVLNFQASNPKSKVLCTTVLHPFVDMLDGTKNPGG